MGERRVISLDLEGSHPHGKGLDRGEGLLGVVRFIKMSRGQHLRNRKVL